MGPNDEGRELQGVNRRFRRRRRAEERRRALDVVGDLFARFPFARSGSARRAEEELRKRDPTRSRTPRTFPR